MSISTVLYTQQPLFLKPTKLFTPFTPKTTLTFPKTTLKPQFSPYKKPFLMKPKAALLPIQPISKTLKEPLLAVIAKLSVSYLEFKEPLLAVANAVGKWVDIYHSVLIVRILLSWFPNMPWEKQPFSAIRDLCDPCLGFFRTIMPPNPANKTIDLSPLLAFVVLGVLSSFLKTQIPPPI